VRGIMGVDSAYDGNDCTDQTTIWTMRAHLIRFSGRFSRRLRGYAKAQGISIIDCARGERKHDIGEEYLAKTKVIRGLFLILVSRAQAPVWGVSGKHHLQ